VILGVLVTLVAMSRSLHATYALLFLTNVALMIAISTIMSLVQLIAPDAMRGRVMSIYLVAFRGGMPLGALVSGYLASISSAPTVLVANGVCLTVVSIYFLAKNKEIRALE